MSTGIIKINGNDNYVWANVVVNILGLKVQGITAIDYEEMQDMDYNHGAGSYSYGLGKGRIKAKGSITFYMEEVEAITAAAPNRRLQDIPPIDVPVSFLPVNLSSIVIPITHTIHNVKFPNNNRKIKEGDGKIEITLEFIATHIDY